MKEMKINHNQVLVNLNNFRRCVHEKPPPKVKRKERIYPVWIDAQTGVMEFERGKGAVITTKKELQLIVSEDANRTTHFTMHGDLSNISQQVQKVAEETLHILNVMANVLAHSLPEEQVVQDLSCVHLKTWNDRIEMFPGWCGSCGRADAEQFLKDRPIGTYMLRKCEKPAQWMIDQCALSAKGYILTVVEEDQKISDSLILHTERGWALLSDEPDLTKYEYCPTLHELMEKIREIAVMPYKTTH